MRFKACFCTLLLAASVMTRATSAPSSAGTGLAQQAAVSNVAAVHAGNGFWIIGMVKLHNACYTVSIKPYDRIHDAYGIYAVPTGAICPLLIVPKTYIATYYQPNSVPGQVRTVTLSGVKPVFKTVRLCGSQPFP